MPTLTVIIPHRNDHAGLERCLEALTPQLGDTDADVIVVDNGSSTLPDAVVDAMSGVRLVCERTPGPGPARTRGVEASTSSILAFTDADCIPADDWIASLLSHFAINAETDIVGGDVEVVGGGGDRMPPVEAYERIYGYRQQLYVSRDQYAATCNMAARRRVFDAIGGFLGIEVAEDTEWGQRASAHGFSIVYDSTIRVATPARTSFRELASKWDRHVAQAFGDVRTTTDRVRWVARAAMVGMSPLGEVVRVARSPRVRGLGQRRAAWTCLARIRIHRARRMLQLHRYDADGFNWSWNS